MMPRIFLTVATIQCCLAFAPPRQAASLTFHNSAAFPIRRPTKNDVLGGGTRDNNSNPPMVSRVRSRGATLSASYDSASNADNDDDARISDEFILRVATGEGGVGEYNPGRNLGLQREAPNVGDPQVAQLEPMNITQVMTELQAIQSQGPKKYCILGTRHCSFLHQQIVEML